jgi:tetratricopeptide (TPR) repeat protein
METTHSHVGIRKQDLLIPLLLTAGAFFRAVFLIQYANSPYWADFTIDEQLHMAWADYISSGHLIGSSVFFRAPLYLYFLGFLYAITAKSVMFVLIIQLFIGWLTGFLLLKVASRLFSYNVGVTSLALYTLTPIIVYFEGQLLLDFLLSPLILLSVLYVFKSANRSTTGNLFLAGLFLGLTALTRPNILVFVPAALILLVWRLNKQDGLRSALSGAALLTIAVILTILPVTIRNYALSGDLVFISSQGGINFYIGNNEKADGASAFMPRLGHAWSYEDCEAIAEHDLKRHLTEGEVSDYWFSKGIRFILDQPEIFVPLTLKKAYLLVNNHELSNNRNISAFFDQVPILTLMPVGMWFLFPLSVVGIIWSRSRPATLLVASYVIIYGFTVIMFFVNSRFRVPLLPGLMILASVGIESLVKMAMARRLRQILLAAIVFAGLLVLSIGNAYDIKFDDSSIDQYRYGNRELAAGDYSSALEHYRSAISSRPNLDRVNLNIGVAFMKLGFMDSAIVYFDKELKLGYATSEALNNLAVVERLRGNSESSFEYALKSVNTGRFNEDALINLARASRDIGEYSTALNTIDSVIGTGRRTSDLLYHRGVLEFELGDYDSADRDFHESLARLSQPRQPEFANLAGITRRGSEEDRKRKEALIRYNIGTIAAQSGKPDSATTMLKQSLKLDSTLVAAAVNLMNLQIQSGDFADAEELAGRILESGERSGLIWYQMAIVYLNTGRRSLALEALDSALLISPDLVPAKTLRSHLEQSKTGEGQ